MLTLSTLETYEQQIRDTAVQNAKHEALLRAEQYAAWFAEIHNELKAKYQNAKGDERAVIRERMRMVTRAADLFLLGLSLVVTKELPCAVSQIIRTEFPDAVGEVFANDLSDGVFDGNWLTNADNYLGLRGVLVGVKPQS